MVRGFVRLALIGAVGLMSACATRPVAGSPGWADHAISFYVYAKDAYDHELYDLAASHAELSVAAFRESGVPPFTVVHPEAGTIRMPSDAERLAERSQSLATRRPDTSARTCTVRDAASGLLVRRPCT